MHDTPEKLLITTHQELFVPGCHDALLLATAHLWAVVLRIRRFVEVSQCLCRTRQSLVRGKHIMFRDFLGNDTIPCRNSTPVRPNILFLLRSMRNQIGELRRLTYSVHTMATTVVEKSCALIHRRELPKTRDRRHANAGAALSYLNAMRCSFVARLSLAIMMIIDDLHEPTWDFRGEMTKPRHQHGAETVFVQGHILPERVGQAIDDINAWREDCVLPFVRATGTVAVIRGTGKINLEAGGSSRLLCRYNLTLCMLSSDECQQGQRVRRQKLPRIISDIGQASNVIVT
eukprot:3710464-Amphidinium_carterae.1